MIGRKNFFFLLAILAFALVNGLALGYINWGFKDPQGLVSYNKIALAVIHNFDFHDENMLFPAFFRRPPGYPLVLALSYFIFGENFSAVVALNVLLLLFSIVILWRLSSRFLDGMWSLFPSFCLSVWWGATTHVWETNSDLFALFLTVFFAWTAIRFEETRAGRWIFVSAFSLALLVLTKPVVLYAVPLFVILFFLTLRPFIIKTALESFAALLIIVVLVGSWSLYSYKEMGTFQLSSSSLTLLRRADDVEMDTRRIKAFLISSIVGDYIAGKFFPEYARDPEPVTEKTVEREKKYQSLLTADRSNATHIEELAYKEAFDLIRANPIKFLLTGLIYLPRLNMPVNLKGIEISHIFVDTYRAIPSILKIGMLLAVFITWFLFVAIVFYAFYKKIHLWKSWGVMLVLIFCFNALYILASHAEARYVLPVMPFYFLLFGDFLANIKKISL